MNKMLLPLLLIAVFSGYAFASNDHQSSSFTVEDYGQLPSVRSLSISPDGKHYGYIYHDNGEIFFVIRDTETLEIIGGANAGEIKARSIYFATNQHVILKASKTTSLIGYRGKWEHSAAIIYNIKTKKMKVLGKRVKGIYPAQAGMGRIVGLNKQKDLVYMPAFMGDYGSENPPYHLLRIKLKNGYGVVHAKGSNYTNDWFVGENGNILAREDYNERAQEHRIYSKVSGKWKKIYVLKTGVPEISVSAVSDDEKYLLFTASNSDNESIYGMSLEDGTISGPLFEKENHDIDRMLTSDLNRKYTGIQYSGLISTFEFSDKNRERDLLTAAHFFPESSIYPVSASENREKLVYKVTGNEGTADYFLYNKKARALKRLASGYPNVSTEQIAPTKAIKYKSRDGLNITSIITWPYKGTVKKNLPLIVFPHGGPASYDRVQFDWWAQYFARKGYLILQPNFRGSTGFGYAFTEAGHGKWGKEMQDDVSDGVKALIDGRLCRS